ncbi:MAG: hypothetical protein AB3N23_08875 [Paracoccaceae bacterium]
MNMFPDYETYLTMFQEHGYAIDALTGDTLQPDKTLYMRHDIDFDCELALGMAEIEAKLGVRSTYFLMLTSDSYNLFSEKNASSVEKIKALGHKISIHFDAVRYEDFEAGLKKEVSAFEDFFEVDVDLISLHRPNEFFLSHDQTIAGVQHTYQSKYLKEIKYVADSRGSFRFGPPEETEAFAEGKSIHLLIHPIWWMFPAATPQASLDDYTLWRLGTFQSHIEANCNTYAASDSSLVVGR